MANRKLFEDHAAGQEDTWFYSGDMHLENGGLFYMVGDPVQAVEVTPSPETYDADWEDEEWWIQMDGDIYVSEENLESALSTCGYFTVANGIGDCTGGIMTGLEARQRLIEAFHAYGGVEGATQLVVSRRELKERGQSLAEYVQQECLRSCPVVGGPKGITQEPQTSEPKL